MKLLSPSHYNTKLRHTDKTGFRVCSLSLAPADSSGRNVCPSSTEACRAACVGTIGMAQVFPAILRARAEKTRFFFEHRQQAITQLCREIEEQQELAESEGNRLALRLNTFSDLPWEHLHWGKIPQRFPDVVFYDYTKILARVGNQPSNYHLCASWSEDADAQRICLDLLLDGHNVAIPFAVDGDGFTGRGAYSQSLPQRYTIAGHTFQVFDGDRSDLRFLDPGPTSSGRGRICGLRLKSGSIRQRANVIGGGFAVVR